jgi:hypothetical protein
MQSFSFCRAWLCLPISFFGGQTQLKAACQSLPDATQEMEKRKSIDISQIMTRRDRRLVDQTDRFF